MEQFNVETATLQEAVEYSVTQMVKQGGQCMRPNEDVTSGESCAYGNRSGQHCAIGWLLDHDDVGIMKSEGGFAGMVSNPRFEGRLPLLLTDNSRTFSILQGFHDAEYKQTRQGTLTRLEGQGIDITLPVFKEWVEMGGVRD